MTRNGKAKGKLIEFDEQLPYADGERVRVQIESLSCGAASGSPQRVLSALRGEPHLEADDVAELERNIERGVLPVDSNGVFDSQE